MTELRLLFVSNFYPPHDIGGYEKHCQEVTDGLRQRGHDVQVLTSRHGVSAPVQKGHVNRALYLESDLRHYQPAHFFFSRSREERYNTATLKSALADFAPDVILFWGMWCLSRRLPAVAESTGIPVAYWLGDLWPIDSDTHTEYWNSSANSSAGRLVMSAGSRLALRRLSSEAYPPALEFRHVACGSQFLKRKLAAQISAFENATIVLCGVDLDPFADCQSHESMFDIAAPRLIYVGGLVAQKGVHTAVEALSRLVSQSSGLQPTLTIVGSGHPDYEAHLRSLATSAGIAEHVQFSGKMPIDAVPPLLSRHDILVVPSVVEEGFGRVVVEGMAAGLPVVGTATGGSAEILHDGVNGLVFPPEDVPALANCLDKLVQDRDLYVRLAAAGKETSRKFDLKQMIDGTERFLLEIVSTRSAEER
jgi:glycosyltransferase involved in cell wall biosynthesis